jgi:two-component system OmpR family sensor kinase
MLPRGLTSRILLAFAGLAVAMLVAVGASLFLVLRDLHQNETKASLGNQVVLIEAALVHRSGNSAAVVEQTVMQYADNIANDGGFILVQRPTGVIRVLVGNPSSIQLPDEPPGTATNAIGTLRTSDGKTYVYIEPAAAGPAGFKFLFAVPDRSAEQALGDLWRALLIVIAILLVIGAPMAWLLSRSLTGPIRRLANAAAALPASSTPPAPLPLQGPEEVRRLTERFNAMAAELAATRGEETALLANLRHDLRTPLTSITGYAEAIADGTASGPAAVSAARTVAEEAQRLERLVGELGVVERLREGPAALRPESLDADTLLSDAVARFEGRATAQGVTLEASGSLPGDRPLTFTADRLAAERILQNLVENALSVVAKGGHVWLRAAELRLPGRPAGVALSVTDDGPGFPPGTSERVFERFFRADPSRAGAGSGLGLAIVRELARAHGGEAWAENVAPRGARVTVLLPFSPIVATGPDAPQPQRSGEAPRGPNAPA